MAKVKIFEPSVAWEKGYTSDTAPGIDERLWKWHRNSAPEGVSKYSAISSVSRTIATINTGIWNAFIDYVAALGLKGDASTAAIGKNSTVYMAESTLPDGCRQISTFNTSTRIVEAATVSTTGRYLPYDMSKLSQECGRVLFLAMLPELLKDEEAEEAFKIICYLYVKNDIENETAGNAMSRLSDNIYRRIENGIFQVKVPASGNVKIIPSAKVKTGAYIPDMIIGGEFKIFIENKSSKDPLTKGATIKEAVKMFEGYNAKKIWTPKEQELIKASTARISDDDIVSPEVLKMALYVTKSSKDKKPIRNFFWRGETGFGKSYGCEELAKILNMPLVRITCFPTMETTDFLTKFIPDTDEGMNNFEIGDVEYPSFEEISYDPVTAYKKITGIYDESATSDMCLTAYVNVKVAELQTNEKEESSAPRFKLVKSDYVVGLSRGYIVEIQEPSIIFNSGVLAGLNEFNRPGCIIPLPDGGHVVRDENAIVIYTDNVSYEGCRPINQSVLRRAFLAIDSYQMSKEDIIARVKHMSEFDDDDILEQMYEVWESIRNHCKENSITDGSVSIEELGNWAQAVRILGPARIRETCIDTVVSKATAFIEEQEDIIASCVDKIWLE